MERVWGSLFSLMLGLPIYLPWVLIRIGRYKSWYLAPFAPPLMWGRAFYGWPAGALFIFGPVVGLLPLDPEAKGMLIGYISIIGVGLAFLMILWTPGWAKPKWQRYIEDKYSWRDIRGVFIPAWRKMDRKEWASLLDSETGIKELVQRARLEQQV